MKELSIGYLKKKIRKLEKLVMLDELTNLPNVRYFKYILPKELNRAKRFGNSLSLMVIDINKFKKINDTKGHLLGDTYIRRVAEILSENIRKYDVLCRYGGDEFVIIFPKTTKKDTEIIKIELQRDIERTTLITVSVGISNYPEDGRCVKTLFNKADQEMYKNKKYNNK
jgi:diguanylate cyclase (GGDEF)-like protein